ncbi:hypothetical protein ACOSP7_031866 [Xanthoceras sorbifolium]
MESSNYQVCRNQRRVVLPSLVTQACDPSGGIEVVEQWFDPLSRVHVWLMTGLPVSSRELGHVSSAKAGTHMVPREEGIA